MSSVDSGSSILVSISVTASDRRGCKAPKRACKATRWRSSWLRTRSMHRLSLMPACTVAPNRCSIKVSEKSMLAAPPQQLRWRPSSSNKWGVRMARSEMPSVSAYSAHGSAMRTPAISPAAASHSTPAPTPPQYSAERQRSMTARLNSGASGDWPSSATSKAICHPGCASTTCAGVMVSRCSTSPPSAAAARRSGCTRPAQVIASASPAFTSSMRSGRSWMTLDKLSKDIRHLLRSQHGGGPLGAPLADDHAGNEQRRAQQAVPGQRLAQPEIREDRRATGFEGVDHRRLVGAAVALAPGLQRNNRRRGDHAQVDQVQAVHLQALPDVADVVRQVLAALAKPSGTSRI